jgi:predicted GH43/DUF377 family glycosyl hydrolase
VRNPILEARPEHTWEARTVFNPGAVDIDNTLHLLYRAMSRDNTSVFGHAMSTDGFSFVRDDAPAYVPRGDAEAKRGSATGNSGCEDPRLTRMEGRVHMCYTAYDGVHAPHVAYASIAESDFLAKRWDAWTLPVAATLEGVDDKDACIFPRTFNNRYLFFHRISGRICAEYLPDLSFGERVNRCIDILGTRQGSWESAKVGIAGVPIETEYGWLMIYHAVSRDAHYALGAALLAKDDPTTVIARLVDPIMTPDMPYEQRGDVPNVVFCNGSAVRGDTLFIYYGGADSVIGVATCPLSTLLAILTRQL